MLLITNTFNFLYKHKFTIAFKNSQHDGYMIENYTTP